MSKKLRESRSATGRHPVLKDKHSKPLYKIDAPNELALADEPQRAVAGADPYNLANEKAQITDTARRRSLDDMRRLSETIKSTPQWARQQKAATGTLYRRLSELCATLERAIAEIAGVREGAEISAHRHVVELIGEVRNAAYHLEGAVISLRAAAGLTSTPD